MLSSPQNEDTYPAISHSLNTRQMRRDVAFYETTLGFRVLHQGELASGIPFAAVAPTDGAAILFLSQLDPETILASMAWSRLFGLVRLSERRRS